MVLYPAAVVAVEAAGPAAWQAVLKPANPPVAWLAVERAGSSVALDRAALSALFASRFPSGVLQSSPSGQKQP